jgi:hypothetical protein
VSAAQSPDGPDVGAVAPSEPEAAERTAAPAPAPAAPLATADDAVESLFARVSQPVVDPPAGGLRAAHVVALKGRVAQIRWRGATDPVEADLAPEVEPELIEQAVEERALVMVETAPRPAVVGILQTRRPRELRLEAAKIEIDAREEVLLRSGRAALRLRQDGDIEIVGSRISAASRGLFRLVGRILRLN